MNIKFLFAAGLLAFASAAAQYYEGDTNEDYGQEVLQSEEAAFASDSSYEQPVPLATEPVSSSSSVASSSSFEQVADMNRLRGRAYNVSGNQAAPLTVDDFLASPHYFHSNQFVYLEPTGANGLLSWGKETTIFLGLNNSNDLGLISAGIATSSFGISIDLALGQFSRTVDDGDTKTTTSVTEAGDNWGLNFSMPVGGGALSINTDWLTTEEQVSVSDVNTDNNWLFAFDANYSYQASDVRALSFRGGLNVLRVVNSTEPDGGDVMVTADTRTEFAPYFNVASMILAHERARVFIGSNNAFVFQLYDGYDNDAASVSHYEMGLCLSPNFLAELAVTKDFIVFGEATHNFLLFGLGSETEENKIFDTKDTDSAMQSKTYETAVSVGARFQKERFAVEAILSERTFSDTRQWFDGTNTLISLGGFIYF
ncbi:MAG: hypothetical protein LBR60_01285 [Fibrobacter sp.]|jgi:hypothetical protein|nr:hypothetical protein [Fibrobacter sp.]